MKNEIINPLKKQEEEIYRLLFSKNTSTKSNKEYKDIKQTLLQLVKELKVKHNYLIA